MIDPRKLNPFRRYGDKFAVIGTIIWAGLSLIYNHIFWPALLAVWIVSFVCNLIQDYHERINVEDE